MINWFKAIPLYIVFNENKITVQRLDTGVSISKISKEGFSNSRIVLAEHLIAERLLNEIIIELDFKVKLINPPYKILIQQLDKNEGGLSSTEKRALLDSCAQIEGTFKEIKILEQRSIVSVETALSILNNCI